MPDRLISWMRLSVALVAALLVLTTVEVAWAQNLRVIPVPWVATDTTVPHHAYNGHPTTFKAIARGGNGSYTYEWDFDGDGIFDFVAQGTNRYDLSARFTYPLQPVTTSFIATIRVTSVGEVVTGSYPVRVFASVPDLPLNADDRQLQIMRSVAVDDGLWYLHNQMHRSGDEAHPLTGAQITGDIGGNTTASAAGFLWALSLNGHNPAWPSAYIGELPDAAGNTQRFRDDPYAEDAARLVNYLVRQATVVAVAPEDEDNRTGAYPEITAAPIAGTDDGTGLYIGSTPGNQTVYYIGHAVAALGVSEFRGYVAQVGDPDHVLGHRLEYVLQQLVDGLVWAQADGGCCPGSWSYLPNPTSDDMSATLWGMTGLWCADVFASDEGVIVPNRVKARLAQYVQQSRHICPGGGFGAGYNMAYGGACDHALSAGHLLALGWLRGNQFEVADGRLAFPGYNAITRGQLRAWYDGAFDFGRGQFFGSASSSIHWNLGPVDAFDFGRLDGRGNHYDMLHWQDAARAVEPEIVSYNGIDWYRLYSGYLIDNQGSDGGWMWTFGATQPNSDSSAGPGLRAAWAILVLSPDAIPPLAIGSVSPSTAPEGTVIDFDGDASDPGTGNPVYVWAFGNGATANGKNVTYAYPDNGMFDATLTSTSIGGTSVDTIHMMITNVAPTTNAGPDRAVDEGTPLPVGMTFFDPGTADTWTFAWDWKDGTTANTQNAAHTWGDNGVFNVIARVTDDDGGTSTDVAVVTVTNVAPTITSTPGTMAQEALPYTYTLTYTDAGILDTQTCSAPIRPAGSMLVGCQLAWVPDFSQAIGATEPIRMCVTDDDGGQACQDFTVNVSFLDSDNDGLPDSWEISNFGNITSQDQFGDPDMDGMHNLQEFFDVTDPLTYDGPDAPMPQAPACGSEVASFQTSLTVRNAMDPQGTPLLDEFQLFTDPGLSILVAQTQNPVGLVPQGPGGMTSWPVPVNLAENTRYYWRARARDQFTFGPYSAACTFFVNTVNEPPGVPRINSPAYGGQVSSFLPTLRVDNTTDPDLDSLHYQFEVFADPALSNPIASTAAAGVAEGAMGTTAWQVANPNPALMEDRFYYWRARACDSDNLCGGWSSSGQFFVTTVNAPPEPPSIVSPASGSVVEVARPPLIILNADDPDLDPLVYDWDVARDPAFATIIAGASDAPTQGLQTTSFALAQDLDEDTRYCFRARADDGQAQSSYAVSCFLVSTHNDPPTVPTLNNPGDQMTSTTATAVFSWAPSTDPEGEPITYDVEVADDAGALVGSVSGVSGTVAAIAQQLRNGSTYRWRARATDRSGASSAFSPDNRFTVDAPIDDPAITVKGGGCQSSRHPGTGSLLALVLGGGLLRRRRPRVTPRPARTGTTRAARRRWPSAAPRASSGPQPSARLAARAQRDERDPEDLRTRLTPGGVNLYGGFEDRLHRGGQGALGDACRATSDAPAQGAGRGEAP